MKYFKLGKKKNTNVENGQYFYAQILDDIFIYGMIMKSNIINDKKKFFNGNVLVVFLDVVTKGLDIDYFIKSNKDVLCMPCVVPPKYFSNGILTVFNVNQQTEVLKINYGFYETKWDFKLQKSVKISGYYDEEFGHKRIIRPKFIDEFGVYTEFGLYYRLCSTVLTEFNTININNNSILERIKHLMIELEKEKE